MVIYNALPRKEYERIFMCNTEKGIWKTLLITHQGNRQVKDNKIDLLVKQYEQFVISKDESIDSAFSIFNTIITSLKALDEGYSSKNYVMKFLRALHHKWRAKKDSEIVKGKGERRPLALKAKKESSNEESSTSGSEDEEYAMAVRDFKKFFKRSGRCGDPNHLIRKCPKPPRDKNQRAFVGGSWSDSGEEDDKKAKDETCVMAQASSEEDLKTKFLSKYCPPARTAKKIEEINNFQQELDENLYQAWERFKELLMKCPENYLTEMQETVLFYNGLDVPTRQILDSRGAITSKTAADAKVAIQEMAEHSQKWHNGISRTRSTRTSDGLAVIQAQLNNLGREIKKVNEKVYAAQVGCEQCKVPHCTKDCPLKEEGKTLEEAYYTQFGAHFQGGGYKATALGFYQRNNVNPSI
ncbi:zf-CCHC domain-containing protein [Tanacetum coccineum]